jgi:hypothetical protein
MGFFNKAVRKRLDRSGVSVFFVSGKVTKWYNGLRTDPQNQLALLGGWYWSLGSEENGPFRTPSAAERDFYYRNILKVAPPALSEKEVLAAAKELELDLAKLARKTGSKVRVAWAKGGAA